MKGTCLGAGLDHCLAGDPTALFASPEGPGFSFPSLRDLSSFLVVKRAGSQTSSASGAIVGSLPPTRWSVVARAGRRERETWTDALGVIVTLYRPVLERYLVCNLRVPADRAEDIVQGFLSEKLLERNVLRQASPGKGRLRSFVLKVFRNYAIGQLRRLQALKRRPESPDAVRLDALPELAADGSSQADAFDVLWARQLLARTVDRMREECRAKSREALWGVFEDRVLGPLCDGTAPMPYEQLVSRFGLRSPSEASNLLITAKRMFSRILRELVRETVADERDVEAEIRELQRVLGRM